MDSMRRVFPWALALAVAAFGCAQSNEAPTPVPIPLAPADTTDTFSGTLSILGTNYHQFCVEKAGEVDITLKSTAYAPTTDPATGASIPSTRTDPIPPLTIVIGTPAATTIGLLCSPIVFNGQNMVVNDATPSNKPQIAGHALAGNLCISVSDPAGTLPDKITYQVAVAHPGSCFK
jgi:hypothetical protein